MLLWSTLALFCLYDTKPYQKPTGTVSQRDFLWGMSHDVVGKCNDCNGWLPFVALMSYSSFFPLPLLWALVELEGSRAVQKGPTVLPILETCVSSPVSIPELAVSKSGFSEACWVLLSTTHDMPWVSWNAKYACWELQEDCVNMMGFII